MILNLIIIIIVLLLSYLFLSNKKETFEALRLPEDFYELHSFEDKLFIKINEKLQEYPNNVFEVLNQVKNKKIVETYIRSGKQQDAFGYRFQTTKKQKAENTLSRNYFEPPSIE